MSIEFLRTPLEKANYLATLLTAHATSGKACQQRLKTDTVLALAAI